MKRQSWGKRAVRAGALALLALLFSCAHNPAWEELGSDYYNLARDFHLNGEYDRAEYYYGECLEVNKEAWDARFNLARLYLETGRPVKAKPLLADLYKRDEENLSVLNSLGVVYAMEEKWTDALDWYFLALEIFPWDETALYNSYLIYLETEQSDEALAAVEKLWERSPSFAAGKALYDFHTDWEPAALIELLVASEPEGDEEQLERDLLLLDLYREAEFREEALVLLETLIEADGENEGGYLFQTGELQLELYRTEEGLDSLRRAFRLGYHEVDRIDALADKLAPSVREVLRRLETLYFPESAGPAGY